MIHQSIIQSKQNLKIITTLSNQSLNKKNKKKNKLNDIHFWDVKQINDGLINFQIGHKYPVTLHFSHL